MGYRLILLRKHGLLRTYLGAWYPIIAKYNRRVVYYAFTGPGEFKSGDLGSPIIALQTLIEHNAFATMNRTEFFPLFSERLLAVVITLGS